MAETRHIPNSVDYPIDDPGAGVAFADGVLKPIAEAKISILDFGFTRSDAVYDVGHVWQGRFFCLDDHLDRFFASLEKARMVLPHSRADVKQILLTCVQRSTLRDAYVAMICTRGLPPKGTRDPRQCVNRFYAYAIPYIWIATPEQRLRGLHMIVSSVPRTPPESVDPTIKNYSWRDMSKGLFEAFDGGGETVVLLDQAGHVNEGPGFNVFAVRRGAIITPPTGVLEGITRKIVLRLCAEIGNPARLISMTAEELCTADEVFITSTAGGILPVTRINGRALGNGVPGPLTKQLSDLYWAKHEHSDYCTPVDYAD